jgi:hypothetical protein
MSLKKHRPPDDARTQFVIVETISYTILSPTRRIPRPVPPHCR